MSANSLLPTDGRGNEMPVLSYRTTNGTANTFASTVSTSAVRLGPFSKDLQIITMYSNADVHFVTGNSTVAATTSSHFWPSGLYYDFNGFYGGHQFTADGGDHYISLITSDASKDANVHVSERI